MLLDLCKDSLTGAIMKGPYPHVSMFSTSLPPTQALSHQRLYQCIFYHTADALEHVRARRSNVLHRASS